MGLSEVLPGLFRARRGCLRLFYDWVCKASMSIRIVLLASSGGCQIPKGFSKFGLLAMHHWPFVPSVCADRTDHNLTTSMEPGIKLLNPKAHSPKQSRAYQVSAW